VLIVVKTGMFIVRFILFDLEALRRLDVLQVEPPRWLQQLASRMTPRVEVFNSISIRRCRRSV